LSLHARLPNKQPQIKNKKQEESPNIRIWKFRNGLNNLHKPQFDIQFLKSHDFKDTHIARFHRFSVSQSSKPLALFSGTVLLASIWFHNFCFGLVWLNRMQCLVCLMAGFTKTTICLSIQGSHMVTFLCFMLVNALAVLVRVSESKRREKFRRRKKYGLKWRWGFFFFFF